MRLTERSLLGRPEDLAAENREITRLREQVAAVRALLEEHRLRPDVANDAVRAVLDLPRVAPEPRHFRWRYYDDVLGDMWSNWHVDGPICPSCCCKGPDDGEHQQASEFRDADGEMTQGHTRLDPSDVEFADVEWQQ